MNNYLSDNIIYLKTIGRKDQILGINVYVDSIYKNQFIPTYNLKSLGSDIFYFYCFDCHKDLKEIKQKFSKLKNNNAIKSVLSKAFHVSLNKIDDTEFNKHELEAINEFLDLKRKISY